MFGGKVSANKLESCFKDFKWVYKSSEKNQLMTHRVHVYPSVWILPRGIINKKLCLHIFKEIDGARTLCGTRKSACHFFLLNATPEIFSLPVSQLVSNPRIAFSTRARSGKPMISVFLYIFFRWNVLLSTHHIFKKFNMVCISQQKFDDKSLFKSEALHLICYHFK